MPGLKATAAEPTKPPFLQRFHLILLLLHWDRSWLVDHRVSQYLRVSTTVPLSQHRTAIAASVDDVFQAVDEVWDASKA